MEETTSVKNFIAALESFVYPLAKVSDVFENHEYNTIKIIFQLQFPIQGSDLAYVITKESIEPAPYYISTKLKKHILEHFNEMIVTKLGAQRSYENWKKTKFYGLNPFTVKTSMPTSSTDYQTYHILSLYYRNYETSLQLIEAQEYQSKFYLPPHIIGDMSCACLQCTYIAKMISLEEETIQLTKYIQLQVPPVDIGSTVPDTLTKVLPELSTFVSCPKCKEFKDNLLRVIMHLNDNHRWSRAAIADWTESLDLDLQFKGPKKESSNV